LPKFKKKPVEVEAMRVNSSNIDGMELLAEWCNGVIGWNEHKQPGILIETLEGTMRAEDGDYIIKGVEGEFYPCKPSIFQATYEQVDW
jgi:hypothetical protein